jgi:murein DD-endopeptidase MepM/ murein hydrolase activator NlpD
MSLAAGVGVCLLVAAAAVRPGGAAAVPVVRAAGPAGVGATKLLVSPAAYFRPVVTRGKAFPVARSNFFGVLEFPNSWHDPRLRLIGGKWLLVGVHEGIDIMAERGTPVLSMTAGVVEKVGWNFYSGTRVGVRGTDGRYYLYAHLAAVALGIVPGARVHAGRYLGRVGNTGYGADPGHRDEFAPHLHFGIQAANDGPWMNPYPTLVALYSATVRAGTRMQASIARLASTGDRAGWRAALARTYLGLAPWPGE